MTALIANWDIVADTVAIALAIHAAIAGLDHRARTR